MNAIKYFPEKPNSKFTYLKFIIGLIILLFVFHHLHLLFNFRKHNHSWRPWAFEIVLGLIGIIYYSLEKLTTEVCFNFEKRRIEISYVTLLKSNNQLNIDFENVSFELKRKQYRTIQDWVLYIYEGNNVKYKIAKLKDDFTKDNLNKMCNQDLDSEKATANSGFAQ